MKDENKYISPELYEKINKIYEIAASQKYKNAIKAAEVFLEEYDLNKIQRKTDHVPYFLNSYIHALFSTKAYEKGARFTDTISDGDCRRNPYICHNAACLYVLTNEPDKAMKHVTMAYEYNYDQLKNMFSDVDLEPLFERTDFIKLKSKFEAEGTKYAGQTKKALLYAAMGFLEIGSQGFKDKIGDFGRLSDLISVIEQSSIGFVKGVMPIEFNPDCEEKMETLKPEFDELTKILGRLAKKGKILFAKELDQTFNHVLCCAANGGIYSASCGRQETKENICILNLNYNTYESSKEFLSTLDQYPNVQSLMMCAMEIDETELERIPLQHLQQLRYLDLSDNNLHGIPDKILDLPNLEWLDLSGNNLTTIPKKLKKCRNLRYLNLKINSLEDNDSYLLDSDLLGCKVDWGDSRPLIKKSEFEKLKIHYTDLSKEALLYSAEEFIGIGFQTFISELRDFNLLIKIVDDIQKSDIGFVRRNYPIEFSPDSDEKIRRLQPVFDQLAMVLKRLAKRGQFLFKDDPKRVFEYLLCSVPNPGMYHGFYNPPEAPENIYCVHYGDMYIEDILDELPNLGQYPNLQSLTLFSNAMQENDLGYIPFAELQQIRHLEISENQLCDLPFEICKLPHLESLILCKNSLSQVWDYYGEMKSLRYLNVDQNCFNEEELSKLKALLPNCLIESDGQQEW